MTTAQNRVTNPRRHADVDDLPIPGAGRSLAVDPVEHVLAISRYDDGAVTFVDTRAHRYRHGTLETSSQVVGGGVRGLGIVRPAPSSGP